MGSESLSLPSGPERSSNTTPYRRKCICHDSVSNNTSHCNQVCVVRKVDTPVTSLLYRLPCTVLSAFSFFLDNTHIINKTNNLEITQNERACFKPIKVFL